MPTIGRLASQLGHDALRHFEVPENDRQRLGRKILDRGILAGTHFVFEKLCRLLMIGHLDLHVFGIEHASIQILELPGDRLMFRVDILGQVQPFLLCYVGELVIRFALIADHFDRVFATAIAQGGMAEVKLSELAKSGQSDAVKNFAKQLAQAIPDRWPPIELILASADLTDQLATTNDRDIRITIWSKARFVFRGYVISRMQTLRWFADIATFV